MMKQDSIEETKTLPQPHAQGKVPEGMRGEQERRGSSNLVQQ